MATLACQMAWQFPDRSDRSRHPCARTARPHSRGSARRRAPMCDSYVGQAVAADRDHAGAIDDRSPGSRSSLATWRSPYPEAPAVRSVTLPGDGGRHFPVSRCRGPCIVPATWCRRTMTRVTKGSPDEHGATCRSRAIDFNDPAHSRSSGPPVRLLRRHLESATLRNRGDAREEKSTGIDQCQWRGLKSGSTASSSFPTMKLTSRLTGSVWLKCLQ